MRFLRRLEQRLSRFAVPQVTLAVIAAQVLTYAIVFTQPADKQAAAIGRLQFVPERAVEDGEWWRLATFVAQPPFENVVFAFFGWYLFFVMGTALERYWGTFRYNLFLLAGYAATVATAFLAPQMPASAAFLGGSVLLAFAFLCPNYELMLFFILPVKVKWFALLTWILYALGLLFGGWPARAMILASVCNFFLFFWRDLLDRAWLGHRRMTTRAARFAASREPAFRHRCATCGITDRTHPTAEFRYCSKCEGGLAYCSDHLKTHEHVTSAKPAP